MLTLVALAAGMGSRFGGPKQLEPIGPHGETLLELTLADAYQAGFRRAIVITRSVLLDRMRHTLATRVGNAMEIRIVLQDDPGRSKPWGTGHAVLRAGPEVQTAFAVANADDLYGADAWQQLARGLGGLDSDAPSDGPARGVLVAYPLDATLSTHGGVSRGVCRVHTELNRLMSVEEIVDLRRVGGETVQGRTVDGAPRAVSPEALVSLNLWGFGVGVLTHLERHFAAFRQEAEPEDEFLLPALVDHLIRTDQLRVDVRPTSSRWIGITHREDLTPVKRAIGAAFDAGRYCSPLFP